MGRDIHIVLEKKTDDQWEFFDPGFDHFDNRNYPLFDYLNSIAESGCPPELAGKKLRPRTVQWIDSKGAKRKEEYFVWNTTEPNYLYGFGHITLEKLKKESRRHNCLWVSAEFMYRFQLLGGRLPDGMEIATEASAEVDDAVGVRIADEDDLYLRDKVNAGIAALEKIAAEHQLQDCELRVCFAFDC